MEIKKTYAVEWANNKLLVETNYTPVRLIENFYYKIKTTPEARGYALNYKTPGDPHIAPDETLFFLYSEIGPGNFELTFRAFFTGAPPICFINEPSNGRMAGQFHLQPNTYKITNTSNHMVVSDKIKNLLSINDNYTDRVESMTFYELDSSAYGYFVEIDVMINSQEQFNGTSHSTGFLPNLPGNFIRWASSVEDQESIMKSGILIVKEIM